MLANGTRPRLVKWGNSRKHRSVCFFFCLSKTENAHGTCELSDQRGTHAAMVTTAALVAFAQICARSTDILHGNSPLLAATSRFNAHQALQLYTKTFEIAILFVHFLSRYFKRTFTEPFPILWSFYTKTASFSFFLVVFPCFFRLSRYFSAVRSPPKARFFCDVLTKMHSAPLFFVFLTIRARLFIHCSQKERIMNTQQNDQTRMDI